MDGNGREETIIPEKPSHRHIFIINSSYQSAKSANPSIPQAAPLIPSTYL
jgi:hypothetical protein